MLLHCGAQEATLEQVKAIPVPQHTETWYPMAYGEVVEYLRDQVQKVLGLEVLSERYGLTTNGARMFACLTMKTDSEESALALGARGSYDKSLKWITGGGGSLFVCDNLMFDADAFMILRKNTKNVWADFRRMVAEHLHNLLPTYEKMERTTKLLKATPCHEQRGYAILGVALGQGLLTPTQATVAYGDWRTPRHEEFSERNMWSLYNAVTEGLKKGSPAHLMERHAKAHSFFTERLAA